MTATPPAEAEARPPGGWPARVEAAALALVVTAGLAGWGVGIRTLGYDFDEATRAHSAWLASRGLRPYGDFFECHPPYFALLSPVVRAWSDPREVLQALRIVAAAGNLLFLGMLAAIAAAPAQQGQGRRWAWLGLAVVATHPPILRFLVEFRVDSWGYALAAWSLYRHGRPGPAGPRRDFEVGVVTGLATMLLCPKLTVLPALVVAAGQFRAGASARSAALGLLAYAGGVGVAAGLFGLYLAWQGIEPGRVAQLLVRYHQISNSGASFRGGLARAIAGRPTLAGLVAAGLLARAVDRAARRARPGPYELGLLAWLAAQAWLVAYPFKQYFAPWFLFATAYLGALGRGSWPWLVRARTALFLAVASLAGLEAVATAREWAGIDHAWAQCRAIRWMDRVAGPEDRVVGSPPLRPLDRRDTFFLWFSTDDPGGFDSEQILARLPSYRGDVTEARYLEELEAHPPALVVVSGDWRMVPYPAAQATALAKFVPARGYRMVRRDGAEIAVRPDCLERARGD